MSLPLFKLYSPTHTQNQGSKRIRRPVSQAWLDLSQYLQDKEQEPVPEKRQALWDAFHQALLTATAQGLEDPTLWHSLATLATEPGARLECFTRAITSVVSERYLEQISPTTLSAWTAIHLHASCLYEIALIHHQHGRLTEAWDFLERAEPLARKATRLQQEARISAQDPLPGSISQLRQTLPA